MKRSKKILTGIAIAALGALMSFCIVGCGGNSSGGGSGSVAATVNGDKIMEADVTADIEAYRLAISATDDDAWAEYMYNASTNPEYMRLSFIENRVYNVLLEQECQKRDITVSDSEINEQIDELKKAYDDNGSSFEEMLKQSGQTEKSYKEMIKYDTLRSKLADSLSRDDLSDEELLTSINEQIKAYDQTQKYQVVYTESKEKAEEALSAIKGGKDFESVQESYNTSGNIYDGWGSIATYSEPVIQAIADMKVGDMSEVVQSNNNQYFIIKVIDYLTVPANGYASLSEVPQDFIQQLSESAVQQLAYSDITSLLFEARQSAEIVINDMPEGLSYDVDMSKYNDTNENTSNASEETQSADAASENGNAVNDNSVNESSEQAPTENSNANAENVNAEAVSTNSR